ncbi:MAG: aspartate--tRNA(Asn) ligase [Candidatus Altiarchaeota archaeon]|nr:aspartate--tRNA(Asn) ligase [Candidatus Altiarchaeota archaeon]
MRSHYSGDITGRLDGKKVVLAGWVHEIRDMGKLKFLVLRDREGFIQVTAKKGDTCEEVLSAIDQLSKESVIKVEGLIVKNEKAPRGVELKPDSIELISKADSPLPLDVTQKVDADMDTRLNNRFMDLRKPEVAAIFTLRGEVVNAGRGFLREKGFVEINTPKIIASASEGGTELFPISYFDREAFLAQSPQLYKQMMMSTGLDRVCELTTYFRAEEHDTRRHLNEVTAFDCEMAFIEDEEDVMELLEGLVMSMVKKASESDAELERLGKKINVPGKIEGITYDKALKLLKENGKNIPWGEDLDTESEKLLGEVMEREYGKQLYFITHFPLESKPFYTMPCEDRKYSRSFDLGYKGVEVASGSQRIHDPKLLEDRIKHAGLNPENFGFYLQAFKYGMPPHGGFGLGLDRVMMQLLDLPIREVVLFPRDRHRLTP